MTLPGQTGGTRFAGHTARTVHGGLSYDNTQEILEAARGAKSSCAWHWLMAQAGKASWADGRRPLRPADSVEGHSGRQRG